MAQDSWPSPAHNSRAVTDSEYEVLSAPFTGDGVAGDPTQDPVVSAAAGLAVTVRANVTASLRGFSWTSGPSAFTLPVAANTSGKERKDWVVLRLDRSAWTVRAAIRQGTPGSGLPALVQDPPSSGVYEITLAQVTVPNNATSVTVTRNELYAGVAVRPSTSARPNTKPRRGDLEYQTDTGKFVFWTGSGWSTIYAPPAEMTVNVSLVSWTVSVDSWLEYRNGVVTLRLGTFLRASGSSTGGDDTRLPVLIPEAYRHPTRNVYGIAYQTGTSPARFTVYSKIGERPGQVWLTQHSAIRPDDYVMPETLTWTIG
ncbi:hypothetical protein [Streptomyces sp. NPDC088674]|uniref:hypothetical protein n=1 Tax=Streptomyces sp. NPDC088674 TaxID=3365869 RepID=UPI0038129B8A